MNRKSLAAVAILMWLASGIRADVPNINVWFTAAGANPYSTVVQQGAQGGDLTLGCDTSSGSVFCEWDLTFMMTWDTAPDVSVISSMATNILGDTGIFAITNLQPGSYPLDGYVFDQVNSGGVLAITKGVQVPVEGDPPQYVPIPVDDYSLLTARLAAEVDPGDTLADGLDMLVNNLLWSLAYETSGPPAVVQFGDAPAVPGAQEDAVAEDVIKFTHAPEPTTLGVLMVGSLLLAARRRR